MNIPTSATHSKLALGAAMKVFPQRLHNFLYLRGLFVTTAEADRFWFALKQEAASANTPAEQVANLRRAFAECTQTAARYQADSTVRTQQVIDQMLATLSTGDQPLVFPGGSASPASILDVGCGNGQITSALAKYWQIEPSQAIGLDLFQTENLPSNITFLRMEPDSLPTEISGQKFDLVVVSLVLHHAEDPKRLLAQLVDALEPGGILVVREHNADSPGMKLFLNTIHVLYEEVFSKEEAPLPNGQNYLSLETWQELTAELGLKQIKLANNPYPAEPKNTSGNFTLVLKKPAG